MPAGQSIYYVGTWSLKLKTLNHYGTLSRHKGTLKPSRNP